MKTKIFTLLIALLASVGTLFAEAVLIGDLYYNLNAKNKTAEVTSNPSLYSGTISIPSSVEYETITYDVTSIESNAFNKCVELTDVVIPNNVTRIEDYTFEGCSSLSSISLPEKLTEIGYLAFYNCSSLTSISLPANLINLEDGAFGDCSSLTSITIPKNVKSMGNAFYGCSGLESIIVEDGNTAYDSRNNCNGIILTSDNILLVGCKNTIIPNSVTGIGWGAFGGNSNLTSIDIPANITAIGNYAFQGCTGLTSLKIPNTVTLIGEDAFRNVANIIYNGNLEGAPWGARSMNGTLDGYFVYGDKAKTNLLACLTAATDKISIPKSVIIIGPAAFANCVGITSIDIPNSVKKIGAEAFVNCTRLTSIVIPNSIDTIPYYAFAGCTNLPSINIPNSVKCIGQAAFLNCTGLNSITIPNSITSIGNDAFLECNNLKEVHISDLVAWCVIDFVDNPLRYAHHLYLDDKEIINLVIPEGVTSISNGAFVGCTNVSSVDISNSVKHIGEYAFLNCTGLTSITIPNSLKSIRYAAFHECANLKEVHISDLAAWCAIEFGDNPLRYAHHLYLNDKEITNLVIPEGVVTIDNGAFRECTGLKTISIPSTMVINQSTEYSGALQGCSNITSVTINTNNIEYGYFCSIFGKQVEEVIFGDSVTSIPAWAFYNHSDSYFDYSNLKSIKISNSVTSIGEDAFYGCTGLPVISNIRYADTYLLEVLDKNLSAYKIKEGTRWINKEAFSNCSNMASITIPNSVISIGEKAFSHCTSLTSIILPDSVKTIGTEAFSYCSKLTSVSIGSSVNSIRNYVFAECPNITSVTINSNSIANDVSGMSYFFGDQVKEYMIGDSVTSIGDGAFYNCLGMNSIIIPNSVISIGAQAFENCPNLMSVTIGNSIEHIGYHAFANCLALTSISLSNSASYIGGEAFANCTNLTHVSLGNAITTIGSKAFYNCTAVPSMSLPNSVTEIGDNAFYRVCNIDYKGTLENEYNWGARSRNGHVDGWMVYRNDSIKELLACSSAAKNITIPNSVTSIGENAFYNCTKLSQTLVPKTTKEIGQDAFLNVPIIEYDGYAEGYPWGALQVISDIDRDTWVKLSYEVDRSNGGGNGYISIDLPSNGYDKYYYKGTTISLTATPHDGGMFKQWSDGITDNPRQVTLTQDTTFTAEFEHLYTAYEAIEIANSLSYREKETEKYYLIRDVLYAEKIAGNFSEAYFIGYVNGQKVKLIVDVKGNHNASLLSKAFRDEEKMTVTIYSKLENANSYYSDHWATSCRIRDGIEENYTFGNYTYEKINGGDSLAIYYTGRTDIELAKVKIPEKAEYKYRKDNGYYESIIYPIIEIGEYAFSECKNLKEIVLSDSITSIGTLAFDGCSNLRKVTIGKSVKKIEGGNKGCFANCSKIDTVVWNAIHCNTTYGNPFHHSYNTRAVLLGDEVEYIPSSLCYGMSSLKTIDIPTSVTEIGWNAFRGCSSLETVNISNQVTCIGKSAFSGCSSLKTLYLGANITSYPDSVFYNCTSLASIYNYREKPAMWANDAFKGVNYFDCTLYTLPNSIDMYKADGSDWKVFYYIEPIGSKITTTETVEIIPHTTTADIVWPTIQSADTYELIIRDKKGNEICALIFNASGQLTSIAFLAPSRNNAPQQISEQVAGFSFTVTGLDRASKYAYTINAKASDQILKTYSGFFNTEGYEKETYTVTFIDWNGAILDIQIVEEDKDATPPANLIRAGFIFSGWDKDYTHIQSDLTITALYSEQVTYYTVTFIDWNGQTLKTEQVESGKDATPPADPVREGYTFIGWDGNYTNVQSNLIITAQYSLNKDPEKTYYTVTFKDWDGIILKAETVEEGKSATPPANPSREGYEFIGWDKDYTNVQSDLTITALYKQNEGGSSEEEIIYYTVRFLDWNDALLSKQTVEKGKDATPPANPSREGYEFTGWDEDYTNVTRDLTIYAQYRKLDQALDQISQEPIANSQKLIKDGQLFILRGDKVYTLTGQEIR